MECEELEPESNYYSCLLKNEDGDEGVLRKLFKGVSESVLEYD
jgi:hypothetical protein